MTIGTIYRSCSELTLDRFIDILVNGNKRRLIRRGFATKKTLNVVWDAIFSEYIELSKDSTQQHMLNMIREYTVLSGKIEIVQPIVDVLSEHYHPELIKVLRGMGFNFPFKRETIQRDLMSVVAKAKTWAMRVRSLSEQIKKSSAGRSAITKSDFDDILSELGAFQGYRINPREVTVSEYVALVNRLKKHIRDGEQRKNNGINRRKGV